MQLVVSLANFRLALSSECLPIRNNLPFEMAFDSKWLRNNPKWPHGTIPPQGRRRRPWVPLAPLGPLPLGPLGSPWVPLGSLGSPWVPLAPLGSPPLGSPWVPLGPLGSPWVPLGPLGFPSVPPPRDLDQVGATK